MLWAGLVVGALALAGAGYALRSLMVRQTTRAGPTQEWNDFTVAGMVPTQARVETLRVTAPASERATSTARIGRVLNAEWMRPDLGDHLLALRGWQGGNVFIVRRWVEPYLVQVIEGAGKVIVEIRKTDGTALVEPGTDLAEYAKIAARDFLSDAMQPKDFHAVTGGDRVVVAVTGRQPRAASWATWDKPDADGLVIGICDAYADGVSLRWEFMEEMTGTRIAFAPPAPYAFGEPVAPKLWRVRPGIEKPESPTRPPSGTEPIKIRPELTPEELQKERN
jgi:hypothetical protein